VNTSHPITLHPCDAAHSADCREPREIDMLSQYHTARDLRRHTHWQLPREAQAEAYREQIAQLVASDNRPTYSNEPRRILQAVR
jgi:hypothetical protein